MMYINMHAIAPIDARCLDICIAGLIFRVYFTNDITKMSGNSLSVSVTQHIVVRVYNRRLRKSRKKKPYSEAFSFTLSQSQVTRVFWAGRYVVESEKCNIARWLQSLFSL